MSARFLDINVAQGNAKGTRSTTVPKRIFVRLLIHVGQPPSVD